MSANFSAQAVPKPIKAVGASGFALGDLVQVINTRTGEVMKNDPDGIRLTLNKLRQIIVDMNHFSSGWNVGDVIIIKIFGKAKGSVSVTLTAGSAGVQNAGTITANTTALGVLSI